MLINVLEKLKYMYVYQYVYVCMYVCGYGKPVQVACERAVATTHAILMRTLQSALGKQWGGGGIG